MCASLIPFALRSRTRGGVSKGVAGSAVGVALTDDLAEAFETHASRAPQGERTREALF
jgi:hypothetical protein